MNDQTGDGLDNDLVAETERLISLSDCGIEINWIEKPFWKFQLFQAWRSAEKEVVDIYRMQTANFERGILKFLGFKK